MPGMLLAAPAPMISVWMKPGQTTLARMPLRAVLDGGGLGDGDDPGLGGRVDAREATRR